MNPSRRGLRLLTDEAEVAQAQARLSEGLMRGSGPAEKRFVGWQGGGQEVSVRWHREGKFWYSLQPWENRYWNLFGLDRPDEVSGSLSILVEVNPPMGGIDRRMAGAYAVDEEGALYLLHRGKIGGGKKGIGKDSFLRANPKSLIEVQDGDRVSPMFVVANIAHSTLPFAVATFLGQVHDFKHDGESPTGAGSDLVDTDFSPEFEGHKLIPSREEVLAKVRHGTVVRRLREVLRAAGIHANNDRARDLFSPDPRITFEVKTSGASQAMYTAVGQLMIHGSGRRVLVVPNGMHGSMRTRLESLGINVLDYMWKDDVPVFKNLEEVIQG